MFLALYIFRSALDVRAKINEAMKMAAVRALAALAKEHVPEQVNIAYGATKLIFGRDYIIPSPFDPINYCCCCTCSSKSRHGLWSGIKPYYRLGKYEEELYDRLGNDNKMVRLVTNRAKMDPKNVLQKQILDVLKAAKLFSKNLFAYSTGEHGIILELKKSWI
jgi:malate dehydrogenase (oxaloacetate-decarboxylating)(NADP+)